jgi:hypothetical protein
MRNVFRFRIFPTLITIFGVICAASAYKLRGSFPPFCIGFGYLFAVLIFWSLRLKRGRLYVYNAAFVFLALASAEFWFRNDGRPSTVKAGTHFEGPYSADYYQRDKELGYSVIPGRRTVAASKKFNDGKTIYSVSYGIDEFGLRATPNTPSTKDSVFFFGDSFTFGEGVSDSNSLPYCYSVLSGRRTRNLGLHGYGPHQMLRALETDRPKLLGIPESPSLVVYIALITHLNRAAGRAEWDPFGPLYEVRNGRAEYAGSFADKRENWPGRMLAHSRIAARLALRGQHRRYLERFSAIVRKSSDLVTDKYAAPFLVLLWEFGRNQQESEDADWLIQSLNRAHVNVIRLSKVIPELQVPASYIPHDGHPNGRASREVANVLYNWSNTRSGSN